MFIGLSLGLTGRLRSGVSAYAVAGLEPELVLDFATDTYRVDGSASTFSSAVTFARASTATYVDSSGTLQTASSGVARVGNHVWNGTSWVNKGLRLERAAATNLLLNSGTLSTQNVTVTAVPHTLHFTGTGTITLSGASTAGPLVGTGTGENNRVSLTFTPSAGTLTCTVTGTVTNAQLEIGSTPSSYIPTSGSTVTRAAETATVAAANMPWNTTALSIQMSGTVNYAGSGVNNQVSLFGVQNASVQFLLCHLETDAGTGGIEFVQRQAGAGLPEVILQTENTYTPGLNRVFNVASRSIPSEANFAVNGTAFTADTDPTILPDFSGVDFPLGDTTTGSGVEGFMGNISQVRVWAADLGDAGISEASA